ncbi:MAG TPA: thioredoxin family protein [Actinomycetes bacterium]|nr:thioredoxin family protein [Actinomycetes bacterium]
MDSLDSAGGLVALVAALAAATALGLWMRRSGHRLGRAIPAAIDRDSADQVVVGPDDLGAALGQRATLVQFSTAFCQPCRSTRRVLADVSATVPGVAHVELDAESQLDLVRRLDVRRTPTVLVLDAAGRVVRRASGQPRTVDVVAALGVAMGEP